MAVNSAAEVMARLGTIASQMGVRDRDRVLRRNANDAPLADVMILADRCSLDYRALFSTRAAASVIT